MRTFLQASLCTRDSPRRISSCTNNKTRCSYLVTRAFGSSYRVSYACHPRIRVERGLDSMDSTIANGETSMEIKGSVEIRDAVVSRWEPFRFRILLFSSLSFVVSNRSPTSIDDRFHSCRRQGRARSLWDRHKWKRTCTYRQRNTSRREREDEGTLSKKRRVTTFSRGTILLCIMHVCVSLQR